MHQNRPVQTPLTVAVIVPVLNEARSLPFLLSQFVGSNFPDELILVDGGSEDETAALAVAGGAQLIMSPAGRARQMNAGASAADSDILWFLHADSILPSNGLSSLRTKAAAGALWGRFNVKMSHDGWQYRLLAGLMNLRSRGTGICTGDMGIFVRRDLFQAQGGFADIPLMEDIEFSRRLRRVQWPRCLAGPLVTSSRRWESRGFIATVVLMWSLRLQYFFGVSPDVLVRRYYPRRVRDDP